MLRYEILGSTVLGIDLHNGYDVIAIANWKREINGYIVNLYIKEHTINLLDHMSKFENIEFPESDHKSIKLDILNYVSTLQDKNEFDYYIKRYEYEQKCFDKGDDFYCKEVNK